MALTKRVPVLLSPEEYRHLKEQSRKNKKPMGEILRSAYRKSCEEEKKPDRMAAFERLTSMNLDLPDWETLEEEIIKGKLGQ